MTTLLWLVCSNNFLAVLNLPACTELDCSRDYQAVSDRRGRIKLKELKCDRDTLSKLVVSGCMLLTELSCAGLQSGITEPGLSAGARLLKINCTGVKHDALGLRVCVGLRYVDVKSCTDLLQLTPSSSNKLQIVKSGGCGRTKADCAGCMMLRDLA